MQIPWTTRASDVRGTGSSPLGGDWFQSLLTLTLDQYNQQAQYNIVALLLATFYKTTIQEIIIQ